MVVGLAVPEPKWVQNPFNPRDEGVRYKQKDFRKLKCFRNIAVKGNKRVLRRFVVALFIIN